MPSMAATHCAVRAARCTNVRKLFPTIFVEPPDRRARRFGRSPSQRSRSANKKATQVGWLFCLLARPEGFEPPTTWFEARCSIQLSYGRAEEAQSNSFESRCLRCCSGSTFALRRTLALRSTGRSSSGKSWKLRRVRRPRFEAKRCIQLTYHRSEQAQPIHSRRGVFADVRAWHSLFVERLHCDQRIVRRQGSRGNCGEFVVPGSKPGALSN